MKVYINHRTKLKNGSYGYIPFFGTVLNHLDQNGLKIAKTLMLDGTEKHKNIFKLLL